MIVQAGADSGAGTNTLMKFKDGNGDSVGNGIRIIGGSLSYGTFTGVHEAYIMKTDSINSDVERNLPTSSLEFYYPRGTIVSMVSSSLQVRKNNFISDQPDNFVISSSIHQDKRVYGVYVGSHEWSGEEDDPNSDNVDQHNIAAIGDGIILVCNEAGNIENGDYITTASGSGGHGCKQNDDILHNYTVAKATETVDWSTYPSSSKVISCTYHCG